MRVKHETEVVKEAMQNKPSISETNCMALQVAASKVVYSAFSLPLNSYPYFSAMAAKFSCVTLTPLYTVRMCLSEMPLDLLSWSKRKE